jgi:putative Mn2+ efflux pump MntP
MNSIITIFLIAVGLAMDAFAVSIGNGIILKEVKIKDALKTGAFFGGFQALMPVIGWLCGMAFSQYITTIDHWIAFGLLVFIGGNMIKESFSSEDEGQDKKDPNNLKVLLVMAIATSIDALAVGVSFAMVGTHITIPAIMIGVITFIISFIGVFIGKRVGEVFEKKAELFGGIILIGIGIKILLEHMNLF